MPPSSLSTYVANRVSVIQDCTQAYVWKHIRGTDNSADVISRGCAPNELADCDLWWKGPSFFDLPQAEWPDSIISEDDPEVILETRCSKLYKLTRVFAYILHLQQAQRSEQKTWVPDVFRTRCSLNHYHTHRAENLLSNGISTLQKVNSMTQKGKDAADESLYKMLRKSTILSLAPYMDPVLNVLRVGGRLQASPDSTLQPSSLHSLDSHRDVVSYQLSSPTTELLSSELTANSQASCVA